MSMTESEAKSRLSYLKSKAENALSNTNSNCEWAKKDVEGTILALDMAISALEEIQQYRAIGTVEELRELKEKEIKKVERYNDKHYCECGCPVDIMLDGVTLKPIGGQIYCDQCGAKLDWSEFVEKGE